MELFELPELEEKGRIKDDACLVFNNWVGGSVICELGNIAEEMNLRMGE